METAGADYAAGAARKGALPTMLAPLSSSHVSHARVNTTGEQYLKQQMVGGLLLWKRPLVEIDASANVDDAIKLMDAQNLTSLPVYDRSKREYIGIITRLDAFLFLCGQGAQPTGTQATTPLRELVGSHAYFAAGPWRESGVLTVDPTATVHSVLAPMSLGVRHVLVRTMPVGDAGVGMDETDVNALAHEGLAPSHAILSCGDIVKFLCEHNAFFRGTFAKTVHELSLDVPVDGRTLVTAFPDTPTVDAFRAMVSAGADAVAVVARDDGRLLSSLTASDLRGLRIANFAALSAPVGEYLRQRHYGNIPAPLAVLPEADLLATAVSALVVHVHRVWVVDVHGRPISMVRLTDVCRCIYHELHLLAGSTGVTPTARDE